MKYNIIIRSLFATLIFFFAACNPTSNLAKYKAEKNLNPAQINEFKYKIIRYSGKLPKKGNHDNKFDSFFDDYYQDLANKHELKYYVPKHTDGYTYFCTYRVAPSLKIKKVALAGRLILDESGSISHYEEIYRTWKFEEEELTRKNDYLFAKLLKGEDLSPYFNHNSGDEEWIEFPDKNVVFDIKLRRWIAIDLNELSID
jgi:hypothetical protein